MGRGLAGPLGMRPTGFGLALISDLRATCGTASGRVCVRDSGSTSRSYRSVTRLASVPSLLANAGVDSR